MVLPVTSPVWGGSTITVDPDRGHGQFFGCTDLAVEPFWASCKLLGGHFHCGIDIPMASGTPLRAARAGVVTVSSYGWLQIKADGTNETDNYVHIDRVPTGISVGKHVAKGQVCCYSGNKVPSGGVTFGPHLHFERQTGRLNFPGSALDPLVVLDQSALEALFMPALTDADQQELLAKTRIIHAGLFGQDGVAGVPLPAGGTKPIQDAIADIRNGVASVAQLETAANQAVAGSFADLKAAIANIKVAGGGLTPEQDEHLQAMELVIQQLEQQFAAGLKVDITAVGKP